MPRAVDKHPQARGLGQALYSPSRSGVSSWSDPMSAIDETAKAAGNKIRNATISTIKELTGIDLSSWTAFFTSIRDETGIDLTSVGVFLDGLIQMIRDHLDLDLEDLAALNPVVLITKIRDALTGIDLDGDPGAVLTRIQGVKQEIFDRLTSIVDSTDTNIDDWLLGLLTAASDLNAGKLTHLEDIGDIAKEKITGLEDALDDVVDEAKQAIRDALTGITGATPTDLDDWLLGLLTGSSSLDAAKLTNITNIPAIAQSKITSLVSDLSSKLDSSSTLDAAKLGNLSNIGAIAQSKITGLATALSTFLTAASSLDAANLSNMSNIPALAQSKVTGLVSDLSAKAASSDLESLLNNIFDGANGSTGSSGKTTANVLTALQSERTARVKAKATVDQIVRTGGQNVALSPDFEDAAAWANAAGTQSTAQKHSGTTSRMLTYTGGYSELNLVNDPDGNLTRMPTTEGRVFLCQVWCLKKSTNTGTGHVGIGGAGIDIAGDETGMEGYVLLPQSALSSSVWTLVSAYLVVPPGCIGMRCNFFVDTDNNSGDAFYVDDVLVTDVTDAVAAKTTADSAASNLATLLDNIFDGTSGTSGSSGKTLAQVLTAIQAERTARASATSTAGAAATAASTALSNAGTIIDNINAGVGLSGSGLAASTVLDNISNLFGTANAANTAAIAAQAQLEQQQQGSNAGATGNKSSVVFSGANGAAISGFTSGPNPNDICIRGNDGHAGIKAGNAAGRYWLRYDTVQYATNDQSVSDVLTDTGTANEQLTLLMRSTSTLSNGAYCHVETDGVKIGYYTFAGGTWTFNQLATQALSIAKGSRAEFRCSGLNYYVLINGAQVLSFTNTGNNVTQGALNRYCGAVMQRSTAGIFDFDGFRLASFSMSDYVGTTVTATSWLLTRSSTANQALAVSSGAAAMLPASTLATTNYANGVTVTTQSTGEMTIVTGGQYEMCLAAMAVASAGTPNIAPHWCLFKNGAQVTGPISPGVPIVMELAAGDVVKPGVVAVGQTPMYPAGTTAGSTGNIAIGVPWNITQVKGFMSWMGRKID